MVCKNCEKKLTKKQEYAKQKFCSSKCYGVWMKENKIVAGKNHPFYGKQHKTETKECWSKKRKGRFTGEEHPMYGKKQSEESRQKMSKSRKGKKLSYEHRMNISKSNMGKKMSEESKRKNRVSRIKEIEEKNGTIFPNYNLQACNWFKFFDKINTTNGKYAVYGGGEFFIKNLGYWVDYINFDKKMIIEWDEEHHKSQKEKDIVRQQQIMEEFPEFEFIRMRTF